jgi:hypothetical protein
MLMRLRMSSKGKPDAEGVMFNSESFTP